MSRIGPTSLRLEPLYIKVRPPLVLSPLLFDRGHWEALQGYVIRHTSSLTKIRIIVNTNNTIAIQTIIVMSSRYHRDYHYSGISDLLQLGYPRHHPPCSPHFAQYCHLQTGVHIWMYDKHTISIDVWMY